MSIYHCKVDKDMALIADWAASLAPLSLMGMICCELFSLAAPSIQTFNNGSKKYEVSFPIADRAINLVKIIPSFSGSPAACTKSPYRLSSAMSENKLEKSYGPGASAMRNE